MKENKQNVPKLRFPGFTDAWEQRKLGDISEGFEYGLNAAATDYDGINKYLRITDIDDESRELKSESLTSPDLDLVSFANYKLQKNDVLFTRTGASVGKTYRYKESDGLVYYAGFLIRARIKPEFDSEFVFQNTLTVNYDKFIKVTSQRSGQPGVNAQEYSRFKLMTPKLIEQKKLGTFFKEIDYLITLHQRKLNNVKKLKSGLLQKMFPKNDEKFPEIRFPEFTHAWEQRKFDSIFDSIPNNTLSRANLNYDNGKIKNVHYGDILIKYGAVIDCHKVDIPFITKAEISDYRRQFLQDGDVLIADAAEDETVGKVAEIVGISNIPVVSGLHTIACRPKDKMQSNYLGYYMNSPSYRQQLLPLMQGIKVLSISRRNLAKTIICYPASKQEQAKIGKIFVDIDHLITLHQRKLEHLQKQKKALLQQMFV